MKISLEELMSQPQQRMLIGYKEDIAGLDAVKPVIGDLTVTLGSWGVLVSGRVQTLLKLTCHRCLKPYFQTMYVDIDERLVDAGEDREARRERELLKDDFVEEIPEDGILDISDIVYQAITLATPTNCLCGGDCPGPALADRAGSPISLGRDKPEEAREDPRWKNLKTLFPNEETGENS